MLEQGTEEKSNTASPEFLEYAYRKFQKMIHSGMWSVRYNNEGQISNVELSDDFRKMLGYIDETDLPNTVQAWENLLHPQDKDEVLNNLRASIYNKTVDSQYNQEYRLLTKNNGYRWFKATGDVYRNQDGSPSVVFGIFIDIDDIKKHNEVLESEYVYHQIHKMLNSGMWNIYYNENEEIERVEWSDDFRRMLGYTNQDDFPNALESWSRLLHPDDYSIGYDSIAKAVHDRTNKTPYNVEYRLRTKTMGYRWFRAIGDVYRRANGSPLRFFGVFLDIDNQKKSDLLEKEKFAALKRAEDADDAMRLLHEQFDTINALSSDYLNIYVVYPETDKADVIKLSGYVVEGLTQTSKQIEYSKVIEKYIETRVHPEDKKAFLKITSKEIIKILSAQDRFDFTYRTFADGEVHNFTLRYTRVSKLNEHPMRVIAGFRNIDSIVEQENRHKEISEESKALALIQETLGSANWSMKFNEKGEMIKCHWSKKFREMIGYNNEEDFPEKLESWSNLLHQEDKEHTLKEYWDTVNDYTGQKTYSVEYRLITKRGWRWFHAAGRLSRREDGSPETFYGMFVDIDDQKHHHEISEEAKALSLIHESLGSGNWNMQFNEKFELIKVVWSDKFRKMLGYNDESDFPSVIESWTDLIHPDYKENVMTQFWGAVRDTTGTKNYDTKYPCLTKDRGYRWFHDACRLTHREDGSPDRLYGVFIDIDDEKKKDIALKDALMVAERANHAKTTFLNNMSHDIRTPMNAIIGFTSLAATRIDHPTQVQEYLAKIQTSSNHLLSLINDVLDMSRIESGKVKIEEKEASLPEILHDLRTIVQDDIKSRQLEFFIDTVDVIHENVICDKLRLNQVLLNLLSNAMKFTKPGGMVGVRILEMPCDHEGYASYQFEVRDSGIGISKEFLPHIFEPFEREKSATVSGIQGTGLGMSITKNIVDMMGGEIKAKSEKGKGTIFTVDLTFRTSGNPVKQGPIPQLEGARALVADDDFNICASLTKMLGDIGMRPDWTTYGKEAVLRSGLAFEQGDPYSAYIIDWLMPDMNGIEVARRIRKNVGANTPIIILTAYDWTDIEEEAREAGVTAFCSKPIFLSELREILESPFEVKNESKKEIDTSNFKGKTLLLVEDNALNREIATELLQDAGFTVDTAQDGSEALEKIKSAEDDRYVAILMDVQMPLMDGYEATKKIRALDNQNKKNIPIIAMTANAFEEDKKEALAVGMNGYIAKPIDIQKMLDVLKKVIYG